jgi:branched-chain amino acid transport system substrate-binding protein
MSSEKVLITLSARAIWGMTEDIPVLVMPVLVIVIAFAVLLGFLLIIPFLSGIADALSEKAKRTKAEKAVLPAPPTSKLFWTAIIAVLLIGSIGSFAVGWNLRPQPSGRPVLTGEIPIGAILALTGDLGSYGTRERVAIEIAQDDINAYLKAVGANFTIRVLAEDTETKPDVCLTKVQSLAARGVKAMIGPLSSGEIRNIKGYIDTNHIVIVSQSSTATDLSIPGDYVFRLVTDDNPQGRVLAKAFWEKGIKAAFLMYRGDTYGDGLARVFNQTFTSLGGTVIDSVRYNYEATTFSVELNALNPKVQQAIQQYGADKVAIELISFEEGAQILLQAVDYPALLSVTWFGCDGGAMSSRIASQAGVQAAQVKLLSTIFSSAHSAKWASLRDRMIARMSEEPDEYSYIAYDCTWVLALSILSANNYDGAAIKAALPSVANNYFGTSGWTQLNAAGDRAGGDYAIYAVVQKGAGYDWERAATYFFASDSISWNPGF